MKRIFSKRGFTIIEVMVAFVIFAIMAAMVSTILQSALYAKQENVTLEDDIAEQKKAYYQHTINHQDAYDDTDTQQFTLDFKSSVGGDQSVSFDYSLGNKSSDGATEEAVGIKLNYIDADLNYKLPTDIDKGNSDNDSDMVSIPIADRLDTHIKGSSGYESIFAYMIAYPDESAGETKETTCRYLLAVKPDVSEYVKTYNKVYMPYMQFRFVFPENNKIVSASEAAYTAAINKFDSIGKDRIGYQLTVIHSSGKGDSLRFAGTMHNSDGTKTMLEYGYLGAYIKLSNPLGAEYIKENGAVDLNKLFGYSDDNKTPNNTGSNKDFYTFTPYYGVQYTETGSIMNTDGEAYDPDPAKHETKMVGSHPNIYGAFVKTTSSEEGVKTDE